jgi:hypothetical protein
MKVIAFTFEEFVGFDLNNDVEIAGWAAFGAIVTVATGAEPGAVFDASWDFDAQLGALFGAAGA